MTGEKIDTSAAAVDLWAKWLENVYGPDRTEAGAFVRALAAERTIIRDDLNMTAAWSGAWKARAQTAEAALAEADAVIAAHDEGSLGSWCSTVPLKRLMEALARHKARTTPPTPGEAV